MCISCSFSEWSERTQTPAAQPSIAAANVVPREFVEKLAKWGWPGQARDRSRGQMSVTLAEALFDELEGPAVGLVEAEEGDAGE